MSLIRALTFCWLSAESPGVTVGVTSGAALGSGVTVGVSSGVALLVSRLVLVSHLVLVSPQVYDLASHLEPVSL